MTSTIKSHEALSNVGWALCLCPPSVRSTQPIFMMSASRHSWWAKKNVPTLHSIRQQFNSRD